MYQEGGVVLESYLDYQEGGVVLESYLVVPGGRGSIIELFGCTRRVV